MESIKQRNTLRESELLSEDVLNELRGGIALVDKKEEPQKQTGDGAQYVCCVNL